MPQNTDTSVFGCLDGSIGSVVDDDDIVTLQRTQQSSEPGIVVLGGNHHGDVGRRRQHGGTWVSDTGVEQPSRDDRRLRIDDFEEVAVDHGRGSGSKLEHAGGRTTDQDAPGREPTHAWVDTHPEAIGKPGQPGLRYAW